MNALIVSIVSSTAPKEVLDYFLAGHGLTWTDMPPLTRRVGYFVYEPGKTVVSWMDVTSVLRRWPDIFTGRITAEHTVVSTPWRMDLFRNG